MVRLVLKNCGVLWNMSLLLSDRMDELTADIEGKRKVLAVSGATMGARSA